MCRIRMSDNLCDLSCDVKLNFPNSEERGGASVGPAGAYMPNKTTEPTSVDSVPG